MTSSAEPMYPSSIMSTGSVPESVSSGRYASYLPVFVAKMRRGSAEIGESTGDDDSNG
jgi:hypothetical protein